MGYRVLPSRLIMQFTKLHLTMLQTHKPRSFQATNCSSPTQPTLPPDCQLPAGSPPLVHSSFSLYWLALYDHHQSTPRVPRSGPPHPRRSSPQTRAISFWVLLHYHSPMDIQWLRSSELQTSQTFHSVDSRRPHKLLTLLRVAHLANLYRINLISSTHQSTYYSIRLKIRNRETISNPLAYEINLINRIESIQ